MWIVSAQYNSNFVFSIIIMVLRHRKPSNVQETVQSVVQELDAFVKVEEHYVEQSLLGAIGEWPRSNCKKNYVLK